jgi:D-glycerate 3-kinase
MGAQFVTRVAIGEAIHCESLGLCSRRLCRAPKTKPYSIYWNALSCRLRCSTQSASCTYRSLRISSGHVLSDSRSSSVSAARKAAASRQWRNILSLLLEAQGQKIANVSLDDFYRSREERKRLAAQVHPLLITRGVPGTHDAGLAARTLDALREIGTVEIPVFDKATDDRRERSSWMRVAAPVDIVLFEGWCVGARPQADEELNEPINDLEREKDSDGRWRRHVNDRLATEYARLFARVDLQILLRAPSFDVVYGWRAEQELKLRKRLEAEKTEMAQTMNAEALRSFIAHFERITRHILDEMPARADVVIALDQQRRATNVRGMDGGFNP